MTKEVIVQTTADRLKELLDGNRDQLKLDVMSPGTTPIKLRDVDYGMQCDIAGIVRRMDDINYFDRDNGEEGQVRGIRIQDSTSDIRCALWGDHADADISVGDPILLRNVEIQDGFQDDIEASVGWSSEVEKMDGVDVEFVTVQLRESDHATPEEVTDEDEIEEESDDPADELTAEELEEMEPEPIEEAGEPYAGAETDDDDIVDDGGLDRPIEEAESVLDEVDDG